MDKIAKRVEPDIAYWKRFDENENIELRSVAQNVAYANCIAAKNMKADAIVVYTHTGDSARNLSALGPECPIIAITDNRKTFNQLALVWNVMPTYIEEKETINKTIEEGIEKLKEKGIIEKGDTIVIAGGDKIIPLSKCPINKTMGGIVKI